MRSPETEAVTITLPKALFEAVKAVADREYCGNVSAVIRAALYKEAGVSKPLELKEDAVQRIQQAERRSVTYRSKRFNSKRLSKAAQTAAALLGDKKHPKP